MYIEPPINYMGSKFKLLPELLPFFPSKDVFLDMFTGGGSIYCNVNNLYRKVIANDILRELIIIHKHLIKHDRIFIEKAKEYSIPTKNNKEAYLALRDKYNETKDPVILLALIWSCNSNMMRFNQQGEFNQTHGRRCFNRNTQKKVDSFFSKSYNNVILVSSHFFDIQKHITSDFFVYLDPPYSNTEAGYNAIWTKKDEELLVEMIDNFLNQNIKFGLSGVLNEKENKVFEYFKNKATVHFFGDMYQKISKKKRTNKEYYITNI